MAFIVNGTQKLHNNENYFFHPKHRPSTHAKAHIWCIDFKIEFTLADTSIQNNYLEARNTLTAFNVLNAQNSLQVVGHDPQGNPCYITKFVNSNPNQWHGYPGDHVANNHDKPSPKTLEKFVSANLISKTEMRRILRGQQL